ncbi:MAG: hypothetical protein D6738_10850 [Acidobacteria bacterium]|nr:MAG: hypothetical protein D6738_10850 [Acidobacteriota bacterium]
MTETMLRLRRSPRKMLSRDGHPGPGPGRMALVMSRAGVGKSAFLVGIGLDSLLAGQRVMHVSRHRTVDKVRERYDEIYSELVQKNGIDPADAARIQLEIERRRHIYTFLGDTFSVDKIAGGIDLLARHTDFRPDVLIVDRMDVRAIDAAEFAALRALAEEREIEVWMSARTHRDDPPAVAGHLPPPADQIEHLLDLVLRLDPRGNQVLLHVLKDGERMLDEDMHIGLDPRSLLLVPMQPSSLA